MKHIGETDSHAFFLHFHISMRGYSHNGASLLHLERHEVTLIFKSIIPQITDLQDAFSHLEAVDLGHLNVSQDQLVHAVAAG